MPTFQHVVLAGSVHLLGRSSAGREVLIEVVEPPDLIIPAAVVTGSPYLMRARVPEPSRLLLIHAGVFRRAVLREPLLAQEVIGSLAGQFRRLVRQIKNLKLRTGTERVGCYLLALSQRQGTPHRAILPYEKNLIASELGMTRESFSRALVGAPGGRRHRPGRNDRDPGREAPRRRLRARPAHRRSGRFVAGAGCRDRRHRPGRHDRGDPMDDVTIALAIHVLAVVLWIGGVAMVTTVLLPAVRRFKSAEERIAFFETIERRFAWQARGTTAARRRQRLLHGVSAGPVVGNSDDRILVARCDGRGVAPVHADAVHRRAAVPRPLVRGPRAARSGEYLRAGSRDFTGSC